MTDKIAEVDHLVQIAANKANQELGDVTVVNKGNAKKLLSTDAGSTILDKYEESEIHRENSIRDPLTGLLNRRGLVEEYETSMRVRKREGLIGNNALVALDLVGLKKLNIELGPSIADQVIQSAAEHLQNRVRETDLVGRWGGDELLLVLFGIEKEYTKKLITEVNENPPEHVRFNIGYKLIESNSNPEESMKSVMNKMEDIKKIGGVDETGRAVVGNTVVVDIDTLN